MNDADFIGIPWKDGGTSLEGCDCRGLAVLWYQKVLGMEFPAPSTEGLEAGGAEKVMRNLPDHGWREMQRGDLVIFINREHQPRHVAIYLGGRRYLHTLKGCESRIDTGTTLLARAGLRPGGMIPADRVPEICHALADGRLREASTVVLLIVSIALSAASAFLVPKPKVGKFKNQVGRYGFDQIFTQISTTIPVPEIMGAVTVAGNSPYQALIDRTQQINSQEAQRVSRVVILGTGPAEDTESDGQVIRVNGLPYSHDRWHPSGFKLDPAQTKAEAMDGEIGGETARPSISVYDGAHAIEVPADVRAQYDRNFPIYGFPGCQYLALRLIDSTKFPEFNLLATVKGALCRTFDSAGFIETAVVAESLAGADGSKTRFKLANADLVAVTSVEVNSTGYTEMAAGNQTGNVYTVNRTKGYIEFLTAPAAAATIEVDYSYHPRAWTDNPAAHLVYLLTESIRGMGFPEDRIDWTAAVTLRDLCDEVVSWPTAHGVTNSRRYTCNYAVDARKPIQDHLRAVLDACYGMLFLSNGRFVMKARHRATSVFSFTESSILRDSFSSEMIDRSQRANRIHLFYNSADTLNAETEVVRDDLVDQRAREARLGNRGVQPETLHMPAVNNQSQAERLAEQILREDTLTRWVVELKTTVKGLALEPGDVVDVTHSSQPDWSAKLFRVEELEMDPEDRLQLKLSEYVAAAYI